MTRMQFGSIISFQVRIINGLSSPYTQAELDTQKLHYEASVEEFDARAFVGRDRYVYERLSEQRFAAFDWTCPDCESLLYADEQKQHVCPALNTCV